MNEDVFHLGIKALIQNKKGEILLLQVNKKELIGHKGDAYWDIPGGRVKRGQDIENTLRTEIEEETGITKVSSVKPFGIVLSNIRIPKQLPDNRDVGLILSTYVCVVPKTDEIVLSKEHVNFGWFDAKKASQLLKHKYPKVFTDKIAKI